jgi:hypothetical protein
MRQLLPLEFANKRAKYIRHRLYAIAAKVIKTGRKVIIKCQAQYYNPAFSKTQAFSLNLTKQV